jgi:hypothetical protein
VSSPAYASIAPGEVDAGSGEWRGDYPVALNTVAGEPGRQHLLVVGDGQRVQDRRRRLDLTAQCVERGELQGRDLVLGEPAERGK